MSKEAESLRQQLAAMAAERDIVKAMPMRYRRMEFNAQPQDENESLRQQLADHIKQVTLLWDALEEVKLRSISLADAQVTALEALAAALAACKAKDEALEQIADDDYDGSPIKIAHKALAIQPDDAALKTWLGEPVAIARVGSLMTLRQQLSSRDGEVTFDRDKIIAAAALMIPAFCAGVGFREVFRWAKELK